MQYTNRIPIVQLQQLLKEAIIESLEVINTYKDENKELVVVYVFKNQTCIHIAQTYYYIAELPF